jgi:ribonuclease P protein component
VVSRKVSKSAVVRNRIRRRIYEHVRILSTSFTAPYDLVFTAFDAKIATVPPAELAADIAKLCKKAGLTSVKAPSRDIVEPKKS